MNIPKLHLVNILFFVFTFNLIYFTSYSQVGIGTVDPDPSSMLEVSSTTQGMLTPRMSTAQRLAISEPANGLLVYDLDERAFYYYEANTTSWVSLNSSQEKRNNFVLVKTLADFPAPDGSGVITLLSDHYYEVNGTINLEGNTINLNNAYLSGLDANEDRLFQASGTIFAGSTGGSIRQLTLLGGGVLPGSGTGTAFNITGATGQRLLLQSTIVANFASVGTLSGLELYFSNIVQYSNNTEGIIYNNIGNLLLSNQAWFGDSGGTFETLTGTFGLVQKISGFSTVASGATGLDVSSNPSVGQGVLLSTVFSGDGTYVNGYTTGSYPGFFFNNNWGVECPGLPLEIDAVATGNVFLRRNTTTDNPTVDINTGPKAIAGVTESTNLFRMGTSADGIDDNLLVYEGSNKRTFNFRASLSYQVTTGSTSTIVAFYISKYSSLGYEIPLGTEVYDEVNNNTVNSVPLNGTVTLEPGDYIRVFAQRISGNRNNLRAYSLSFSLD
ncbi:MAG: hypothetical protein WDZ45_00095 [Flavobacteriaceae bacterium]